MRAEKWPSVCNVPRSLIEAKANPNWKTFKVCNLKITHRQKSKVHDVWEESKEREEK